MIYHIYFYVVHVWSRYFQKKHCFLKYVLFLVETKQSCICRVYKRAYIWLRAAEYERINIEHVIQSACVQEFSVHFTYLTKNAQSLFYKARPPTAHSDDVLLILLHILDQWQCATIIFSLLN